MSIFGNFNPQAPAPAAPAAPAAAAAPARPAFAGPPAGTFAGGGAARTNVPRPSNLFAGVPSAEAISSNPWLTEGTYFFVIHDVLTKTNRKGQWRVIVEGSILSIMADPKGTALRPGTKAAQAYSAEHDSFSRSVKGFILAALRLAPDQQIEQSDVELACGAGVDASGQPVKSPLCGMVLRVTASMKPTRSGGLFTETQWSPGPTLREIAAEAGFTPEMKLFHWPAPGLFDRLLALETQAPRA